MTDNNLVVAGILDTTFKNRTPIWEEPYVRDSVTDYLYDLVSKDNQVVYELAERYGELYPLPLSGYPSLVLSHLPPWPADTHKRVLILSTDDVASFEWIVPRHKRDEFSPAFWEAAKFIQSHDWKRPNDQVYGAYTSISEGEDSFVACYVTYEVAQTILRMVSTEIVSHLRLYLKTQECASTPLCPVSSTLDTLWRAFRAFRWEPSICQWTTELAFELASLSCFSEQEKAEFNKFGHLLQKNVNLFRMPVNL
jgi:hypothetical protein